MATALDAGLSLQPVAAADFDALLALRIRAMQPSLQALGRFDPERARERFASIFAPEHMHHIVQGGVPGGVQGVPGGVQGVQVGLHEGKHVGCVTLRPKPGALRMDHLYIEPAAQGQGIGAWVMVWACALADLRQHTLELAALQGSDANRFYQRHGLVELSRSDFDIEYRRAPATNPLQVVRALWQHLQAREWAAARALLHDEAVIDWPATGERLEGADAFISANAPYPEGWTLHLLRLDALQDGRVMSTVRVDHPPATFLVQSVFRIRNGRIQSGEELWATVVPPRAWRTPEHLPGLQRLALWQAPT